MRTYLSAAAHPWASFVFLLPLLLLYEGGVWYYADTADPVARTGADEWVREGFGRYGLGTAWAAPAVVAVVLGVMAAREWKARPKEMLPTAFGMAIESILFAVLLWALAKNFGPLLDRLGPPAAAIRFRTPAAGQLVTYVGAGIYEEVLFRLGLFTGLFFLLRRTDMAKLPAALIAAAAAALLFAYAHHVGPNAEALHPARFAFRTLAGLYFTALFVTRGFGITVGAHAGYDILVGVAVG